MPDDITDLFPLATESPEAILGRMQADINAGIDPTDPLYADIVGGAVWDDLARADALEMDRVYDRMLTEVPSAALPAFATGTWLDQWASVVGLQRKAATHAGGVVTFTGPDGTIVSAGAQTSSEAPTPDAEPITFQTLTTGTITGGSYDADVQALDDGTIGNVPANAVTLLDTPLDGVTVSNALRITGGSDVETDEALQARVLAKLRGTNGAGNIDYYINLALNYPGVGYATVEPNTPSIGHVTVVISDVDRQPAPTAMVNGLQAQLDPSGTAGQGAGLAAPGATVIVSTPATTAVAVVATIVPEPGYTLTGTGGTQPLTAVITAAVTRYFLGLEAGDDVIASKVSSAIVDVDGVADISALTLNGSAGNAAIAPDHIAVLTLPLTLS